MSPGRDERGQDRALIEEIRGQRDSWQDRRPLGGSSSGEKDRLTAWAVWHAGVSSELRLLLGRLRPVFKTCASVSGHPSTSLADRSSETHFRHQRHGTSSRLMVGRVQEPPAGTSGSSTVAARRRSRATVICILSAYERLAPSLHSLSGATLPDGQVSREEPTRQCRCRKRKPAVHRRRIAVVFPRREGTPRSADNSFAHANASALAASLDIAWVEASSSCIPSHSFKAVLRSSAVIPGNAGA